MATNNPNQSFAQSSAPSSAQTQSTSSATFGSRTDIGLRRDQNEDSLIVAPPLFAIADGMGGHAAGEVASEIAITVLSERAPAYPDGELLAQAVRAANRAVYRAAREGKGREGMGTTMTACMLEGERLVIAQVGDSRAYLLHQGELQQLTRDHSLMADMIEAGQITPEEARVHPNRSIITRALGSAEDVSPDIYEINVETGDRLLICSDGLSGMVRHEDIESTLCRVQDPQQCASQLVDQAIAGGGHDNITAIVVDVTGFAEAQTKKTRRRTRRFLIIILVVVVLIIAAAGFGAYTYLDTVAYLGNDNGKVAIYRGVPDTLAGMTFSTLERTTDVSVDDLQPGVANRLDQGIRVDNIEAAEALVKEYEQEIAANQSASTSSGSAGTSANSSGEDSTNNANSSNSSNSTGNGTGTTGNNTNNTEE